jgi:hypothetical protein
MSKSLRWNFFEIQKKYVIKASYVLITSSILEISNILQYSFSSSDGDLMRFFTSDQFMNTEILYSVERLL